MKKILLSLIAAISLSVSAFAQAHSDRITFGVGLLYENGLDATLSWEHETKYHKRLPGILLEELPHMGRRCSLQAVCGTWTKPLRQCPHRSQCRQ